MPRQRKEAKKENHDSIFVVESRRKKIPIKKNSIRKETQNLVNSK